MSHEHALDTTNCHLLAAVCVLVAVVFLVFLIFIAVVLVSVAIPISVSITVASHLKTTIGHISESKEANTMSDDRTRSHTETGPKANLVMKTAGTWPPTKRLSL